MKNDQPFEKLALGKEVTKNLFGGLLDDDKCPDQSIEQCASSFVKYKQGQCKLNRVWVMRYCVHPNEAQEASTHPNSWFIQHYYCYEPIA